MPVQTAQEQRQPQNGRWSQNENPNHTFDFYITCPGHIIIEFTDRISLSNRLRHHHTLSLKPTRIFERSDSHPRHYEERPRRAFEPFVILLFRNRFRLASSLL
jgi:hypothetical protein